MLLEISGLLSHKVSFWLSSLLVVFIIVFRDKSVGGDTERYWQFFQDFGNTYYGTPDSPGEGMEPGFVAIGKLFIAITKNGYLWIAVTGLLNMIPYMILVKRESYIKSIPFFLMVSNVWGLISTEITALRQIYAVSFAICAYLIYTSNIKRKKKLILTVACLIMSMMTHNSMLIALPLLLIAYFLKIKPKYGLIAMVSSLVIVLVVPNIFSSIFNEFYAQMRFVDAASRMTDYYDNANYDLTYEISFNRLGPQTLAGCLVVWLGRKDEKTSMFALSCIVLGICMYNIGAEFPMMTRAAFALTLVGSTYVPVGFMKKKNRIARWIYILLMIFFLRTSIKYYNNYEETGGHLIPYTFIWEKYN